MTLPTVNDAKEIAFPVHPTDDSLLTVFECISHVPFAVERVFTVDADNTCRRGEHAHRACHQLLVCLRRSVRLIVKDGRNEKTFTLCNQNRGIFIPAGLWAEQEYEAGSLLMVLASHKYNENDYIRDYNTFLKFRENMT